VSTVIFNIFFLSVKCWGREGCGGHWGGVASRFAAMG